jgi:DNA polymerase alpha subunit B
MVINPGTLSKRKATGTYTQMSLQPRILRDEERTLKSVPHKIFERARVDVIRI